MYNSAEEMNDNVTIICDAAGNPIQDERGRILLQNNESGEIYYIENESFCSNTLDTSEVEQDIQNDNVVNLKKEQFTDKSTKLLLELYYSNNDKFRDSTVKKRDLWRSIADEMSKQGYHFNDSEVERKFRNLKSHFIKIKDENTKTGRGRLTWAYYATMEKIFEKDACVNPAPCVSSMELKRKRPDSETRQSSVSEFIKCNKSGPSTSTVIAASSSPSGFDLISALHPNTEMLPENASPRLVQETTANRRLSKQKNTENPHIKRVRKQEPEWVQAISSLQKTQTEELSSIKAAVEDHNRIQQERNNILKKLMEKF